MPQPQRILVVLGVIVLVWLLWLKPAKPAAPPRPPSPASVSPSPPAPTSPISQLSTLNSQLPPPSFPLNSPTTTIAADLHLLSDTLETFRTNFPRDGNPVGENAEITAALTGKNKLHLVLIPPGHPAIDARGELCDRWGTPFFFHQLSGTEMEIRSAGPDKKLHTADDIVLTP